ncbi:MAG: hypothetical protein ACWA44_14275 [Thiotrichales bacterium]
MSSKKEAIAKMLEMQKKFIALEHENGVEQVDYFTPKSGDPLDGYREEYADLASSVIDAAHEEVGSAR